MGAPYTVVEGIVAEDLVRQCRPHTGVAQEGRAYT
jgi:hypothetical protein